MIRVSVGSPTIYFDDDMVATTGISVTDRAGVGYVTMFRVVVPVDAGDVLDINARGRVTNDAGYVVGVGYHLWAYDVDGDTTQWWKVGTSNGDNVSPSRHHMPLHIDTLYQVPANWPNGHRIVIVLRADAHSTAHDGQKITADPIGGITVRRYQGVASAMTTS